MASFGLSFLAAPPPNQPQTPDMLETSYIGGVRESSLSKAAISGALLAWVEDSFGGCVVL